jgi:pilus assembly protein FimV
MDIDVRCVLLLANYAAAVGLGELKLQSTLNEPFRAEVKLLNLGNVSADEVIVSFAAIEDFQQRKIEHFFFYSDFRFEVVMSGGVPVARITSSRAIQEPYLGFILEARWPTGRLQREYTVLLDMPARLAE